MEKLGVDLHRSWESRINSPEDLLSSGVSDIRMCAVRGEGDS